VERGARRQAAVVIAYVAAGLLAGALFASLLARIAQGDVAWWSFSLGS
jgi:hypothetical protein